MNADEPKPVVKAAGLKPETTAPVPDPKALTRNKNADEPKPATPVEIKTAGKPDAKLGTTVGSKPKVELEETKPEAKTVAPKTASHGASSKWPIRSAPRTCQSGCWAKRTRK